MSVPVIGIVIGEPNAKKPISNVGKRTSKLKPRPNITIHVATLTRSR